MLYSTRYHLHLQDVGTRDDLIKYLKRDNVHSVFHYVPLHTAAMGREMGYNAGDLPITEDLSVRLIRHPCYFELTQKEQDRVIEGIYSFFS